MKFKVIELLTQLKRDKNEKVSKKGKNNIKRYVTVSENKKERVEKMKNSSPLENN